MSEDELLSALNGSESVNENEKNSTDTESIKKEDYDANEIIKKPTMPDPTKEYKTIRDIRKENCDKDMILRDLDFTLDAERYHYKPKKTVSAFNNNYI